ncbi:zinc finger protein 184-like [Maniola hyperantus]|uniref:zinc finger protein 184-like n=1 Tax=Aphantopus hyperantus TaxID=2795564 RepID=UPI003749CC70
MKCCVPSCNSLKTDSKNTQKVTFHKVPKEKFCRVAWFAALGIEESDLPEAPVVCSLHFKDSNFYNSKNGSRIVQRGAVPFVQVCMICLDTNCRLYPLSKYNLEQAFEILTGLQLQQAVPYLTPAVCSECAQRLTHCSQFRHKSLRAHVLLFELFKQHELLTVSKIRTISRQEHGLASKITHKLFKPNHCDLNVVDSSSVEIEIDNVETKSIVKVEKQDEIVIAFEPKENDSLTELATHDIKSDYNEDIDIDVDFLNDENDGDFLNNDDGFSDDNLAPLNDKKINASNLAGDDIEVGFVSKIESDKGIDEKLPKKVVNNVKRTRKVNPTGTKTVRNRKPAAKRNVTKKVDESKPKRAPRVKKSGAPKLVRKVRDKLSIFETTKLTLEEQIEEINKRKETSNYKNSSFQCDVCYRGFISETTYTRHMEKHSKSFGTLECPVCKQYVSDKHALHKHSKAHATRYKCTLCDFTTMTNESARMHENWHKGTRYNCEHCEADFVKYTSYMTHLRVKHPSDHICNQCGYSYLNELGLRAHLRRIHRTDKIECPDGPLCAECNVRFASQTAYEQHLKVSPKHYTPEWAPVRGVQCSLRESDGVRTALEGFPQTLHARCPDGPLCAECNVRFASQTAYEQHLKCPDGPLCAECNVRFASQTAYEQHLKVSPKHYTPEFPPNTTRPSKFMFQCPDGPLCAECNVRFASQTAYEQHLKVSPKHYTPETRQVNQPIPPRCYSKGTRRHKRQPGDPDDVITCEQCGIELKDFLRYTFHFKREHPDKNRTQFAPSKRAVLCEQCGRSFQSPHHLKYHMAKHTGQKDFQCDVCEKRFRIKAFLDKHKETHMAMTARRLYTCGVCEKTFTCHSSLNRHIWIHRGKSFKCEICEKAFSNASERNCHVSHVHMKVPWPKRHRGPNNRGRRPSLTKDENYDE